MTDDSIFTSSVNQSLWECPVWRVKSSLSETFNTELVDELHAIAQGIRDNTDTVNGTSLVDYDRPRLRELFELKKSVIEKIVNPYFPPAHEAIFKPLSSWLNVNEAGERIELHAHPLSAVTCTYYIRAPEKGGDFYYVDTGRVGEHKTEVKYITPETGDLVFFPSYVLHGVGMNLGKLRISLSTDFDYSLTNNSEDKLELRSFVDNMLKIKNV